MSFPPSSCHQPSTPSMWHLENDFPWQQFYLLHLHSRSSNSIDYFYYSSLPYMVNTERKGGQGYNILLITHEYL